MITVVTGNKGKAAEVAAFFDGIVEVTHTPFEAVEPQAENIADIAFEKARQAYEALDVPLIVDDTGLFRILSETKVSCAQCLPLKTAAHTLQQLSLTLTKKALLYSKEGLTAK